MSGSAPHGTGEAGTGARGTGEARASTPTRLDSSDSRERQHLYLNDGLGSRTPEFRVMGCSVSFSIRNLVFSSLFIRNLEVREHVRSARSERFGAYFNVSCRRFG